MFSRLFAHLEAPAERPPRLTQAASDFGLLYAANGLVSWLFAVSAPVAIVLAVGSDGRLREDEIASWIFAVFFLNGALTVVMSWLYRQPLVLLWTIPGAVLVGQALGHLSFPQIVGAYYATGVLMFVLGATGLVRRAMGLLPMPIVMGMVAGVFLRFGLDLVRAILTDTAIAGPMAAAFLVLSAVPQLGRRCPPVIGTLAAGALATVVLSRYDASAPLTLEFIRPTVTAPAWSLAAMVELVVPLAITVLAVQNGQGIAVLRSTGHPAPPINAITLVCGIGSVVTAVFGGISTCLTGAANAIAAASGKPRRHYTAAMVVGALSMVFGALAPTFTRLLLSAPKSLVTALSGLAMLRVLQAAFVAAFKERFALGALTAFLVTTADIAVMNVGAAFWGLVAGAAVSWLLERGDFEGTDIAVQP